MAEGTTLGPLASKMQQDRVRDYIAKGIADGCELLAGGAASGGREAGRLLREADRVRQGRPEDATIAQEEIFGPVLSIITYRDEDDAVRIANDSIYGLSGGVWSATDAHAEKRGAAPAHRPGRDQRRTFNLYAPFGGYKQSGNGRELGKYGLEDFLEFKKKAKQHERTSLYLRRNSDTHRPLRRHDVRHPHRRPGSAADQGLDRT
jgi:aldehyde dehydrogenase (NAD+)